MSTSTTSAFQASLLPLSAVQLGRLILNIKAPHEDYVDPPAPTPPEVIKNPQRNFTELRTSSNAFKLRGRLTQLLSASYEHESKHQIDLSATIAYTYALCNSGAWFKAACAHHSIRRWLQDAIEDGDSVYLVTGYHTVVDARFGTGMSSTSTDRQQVSMPIDATGLPSMQGMDMTAGVDTSHKLCRGFGRTFEAPGEQVYAVQFRKVVFRWFSSRKIEKGMLKENQWRVYAGRGPVDRYDSNSDSEDEEDAVEASLGGLEGDDLSDDDDDDGIDGEEEDDDLGETWVSKDDESVWVL
ncbi:uncharacterized protein H6S33_004936 [Morchella sextelata]|uniref:uncharacterized protein n=1 Tax=Morchella sextelata TaxID=1174677 RepID=UPI001D03E6DA|nr:uncharacterized protein H6S33_004936 [Morchella sextelata]KAH0604954.1 hypothetical protein H6S33_004936 [Morchella sextelata]